MSFLRTISQPFLRQSVRTVPRASFSTSTCRAAGDYGGDEGAPPGQKPSEQIGKNPSEHLEHPGPAPPSVAGGSKEQGTKGSGGDQTNASNSQQSGESSNKGTQGAQPKIFNPSKPSEESEDVKKHNQQVDQRAEQSHGKASNKEQEKDKVSKPYWSDPQAKEEQTGSLDRSDFPPYLNVDRLSTVH
ncbi:hypothetical protein LTR56_006735 [Elasticomyces elasticus]|nr:hypothetical protein LTR22_017747 [Elasticomyces elasticus]KAK3649836.1 hypothetical protein LTR56_006735 [Elasticomyces elasticus]KAK4913105.1 hypothetical protein LTR49_018571 [Elasticomyces elasticus]KAK5762529.1 hypothetical protein LTS12_007320 [Elasticomyces elasticus]